MNLKDLFPFGSDMLDSLPVERSSRAITSHPLSDELVAKIRPDETSPASYQYGFNAHCEEVISDSLDKCPAMAPDLD